MKFYDFGATAILLVVLAPVIGIGVDKAMTEKPQPMIQQCVAVDDVDYCRAVPADSVDNSVWDNAT